MKFSYYAVMGIFFSSVSFATVPIDPLISLCHPYPEIKSSDPFPKSFNTTNNLARSPESGFYKAQGQRIVIYGRLMDKNCVPINDAKIFIWQANMNGYFQYKSATKHKVKWYDPNFDGTGITNTDNLGRFNLVTILPGSASKVTPHINLKIEHPMLKDFSTKVYFPANGGKIYDSIGKKVKLDQVSAVPGGIDKDGVAEYFIDITLHQQVPHKEY